MSKTKENKVVTLLKEALGIADVKLEEEEAVKLATETLDNGVVLEAESFEAGSAVFIVSEAEDEANVPLPVGEYTMADGKVLVVTEDGVIAEIKDATEEVEAVEEELKAENVSLETFNDFKKEILEAIKGLTKEESTELETAETKLAAEVVKLKAELAEKEDAKTIVNTPKIEVKLSYDKMTNFQKLKENELNGTR